MANPDVLMDRPPHSVVIDGLFKSDRPRTIDRYIDYFGGEGLSSLGDLGGGDTGDEAIVVEERTA